MPQLCYSHVITDIKQIPFFFSQANLKTQAFIPATSFLKGRKDVIHFKGQMLLSTTELQLSAVGIFLLLA